MGRDLPDVTVLVSVGTWGQARAWARSMRREPAGQQREAAATVAAAVPARALAE